MAILTNTVVSGNLRSNGLITTNKLYINGLSAMPMDPNSTIDGNETSTELVSAKQVVDYIHDNSIIPYRSGGTVSWDTGWVSEGEISMPQSSIQSNQSLNAGGSVTLTSGWLNNNVVISANSLSSQTSGTAAAGDILSGKTAWVNGSKVTGNIATKTISNINGASTAYYDLGTIQDSNAIPAGGYLNIPAGYYASGISIALGTLIKDISNDAAAAQILSGYKAISESGALIEGTMTNRGGATYTITPTWNSSNSTLSGSITIQPGYHNGSGSASVSVAGGTTTPNTILPSGSTEESTKTLAGNYIKVGAGYYPSDKYYRAQTLANQTGVDSGKTAATAAQILTGHQAWVNGNKITGNMSSISLGTEALTMSESTSGSTITWSGSKTLSSGFYPANDSTITASKSLTIVKPTCSGGSLSVVSNCSKTPVITLAAGTGSGSNNVTDNTISVADSTSTSTYPYYFKIHGSTGELTGSTSVKRTAIKYTASAGYLAAASSATDFSTAIGETSSGGSASVTVNASSKDAYVNMKAASITCSGGDLGGTSAVTLGTTDNGLSVERGAIKYTATGGYHKTESSAVDFSTAVSKQTKYISAISLGSGKSLGSSSSTGITNAGTIYMTNSGTTNITSNTGTVKYEGWTITKDSSNNLTFTYA